MSKEAVAVATMMGTYGSHDYLVLDKQKGLGLGIKAVSEVNVFSGSIHLGFRVRAAALGDIRIVNVEAMVDEVYPNLPWVKKDNIRCSFYVGLAGPVLPTYKEAAKVVVDNDILGKVWEKTLPVLEPFITMMSSEELLSLMTGEMDKALHKLYKESEESEVPEGGKIPAVVLPFKKPKGDNGDGNTFH